MELGFRKVAKRLQRSEKTDSLPLDHLLRLLQSGNLTSVMLFPSELIPKMKVPTKYWNARNVVSLEQVIKRSDSPKHKGRYVVRVGDLIDDYLKAVFQLPEENKDLIRNDIREVYVHEEGYREAVIQKDEWQAFCLRANISEVEDAQSDEDDDDVGGRKGSLYRLIAALAATHGFVVGDKDSQSRNECVRELVAIVEAKKMRVGARTITDILRDIDDFASRNSMSKT